MEIKVGCCGFSIRKKAYFETFKLVELQETFYNIPKLESVYKWRNNAPKDFEFTVKAWQVITHPSNSPTWRRIKTKIIESEKQYYGLLKPTRLNFEAWNKTLEVCKALKSKVCLLQTPPQFNCTKENIQNMYEFLSKIQRNNLFIAWEPRGDWKDPSNKESIKKVCEDLKLIHVVDLLRYDPIITCEIVYTRLHGLGLKEYNYSYKYTDEDLKKLLIKIKELEKFGISLVYVLFNNVWMGEDAKRFINLLEKAF
jgi:uncharacterized protein YecE (DUF72 family)